MDSSMIDVRPLSQDLFGDYLRFFDDKAFTDNPRWAFCYCYFPYHDPDKIDFTTYVFDLDQSKPTWVFAVALSF